MGGEPWDPTSAIPDLRVKVAVVTGGNAGLGLHTVKHLVVAGAKVYFTARSHDKAKKVSDFVASVAPDVPQSRLLWLPLDLGDIKTVLKAVNELQSKEVKVDILINSAGVVPKHFQTTDAGWEMALAVNYIGHFVFTNGLLPLLKQAAQEPDADVRVITVATDATTVFIPANLPLDFGSPSFLAGVLPYEPWQWRHVWKRLTRLDMFRYSISKLATIMFAQELQGRFEERELPILSLSLNPRAVASDTAAGAFIVFMRPILWLFQVTENAGSYHSVFSATSKRVRDEPEQFKGKYLEPIGKPGTPHQAAKDEEQVQALWENTTNVVNKYLVDHGLQRLTEW